MDGRFKSCAEPDNANFSSRGFGLFLQIRALCTFLRTALRLIACDGPVKFTRPFHFLHAYVTVHRFNETIGGRAYQIEVTAVSNRWRAQLRRTPGMPTAMMPFYGQTPDEAARQLTDWLTLAYRRLTAPQAPVPR